MTENRSWTSIWPDSCSEHVLRERRREIIQFAKEGGGSDWPNSPIILESRIEYLDAKIKERFG